MNNDMLARKTREVVNGQITESVKYIKGLIEKGEDIETIEKKLTKEFEKVETVVLSSIFTSILISKFSGEDKE